MPDIIQTCDQRCVVWARVPPLA